MRWKQILLAVAATIGLATTTGAQSGRGWFDLTPDEQRRAWENYQRYQRMPDRQRGRIEQRYQAYQALPPQEREQLRKNYDDLKGLDKDQRREFDENYRRWKSSD